MLLHTPDSFTLPYRVRTPFIRVVVKKSALVNQKTLLNTRRTMDSPLCCSHLRNLVILLLHWGFLTGIRVYFVGETFITIITIIVITLMTVPIETVLYVALV